MPSTRVDKERDAKRAEIVAAARRLFAARGFAGTSLAAVAAEVHVTKNTIYWYFEGKDSLLLAVVATELAQARSEWFADGSVGLAERMVRLTAAFDEIHPVATALHARLPESEEIRDWHERFHEAGDRWIGRQIAAHLATGGLEPLEPAVVAATAKLWTMAIDGMVTNHLAGAERAELWSLLVRQLEALATPSN